MWTKIVEDGPEERKIIDGARTLAYLTGATLVPAQQSHKGRTKLDEHTIIWDEYPDPLRDGRTWSDFAPVCLRKLADALTEAAQGGPLFIEDRPIDVVLLPLKKIERLKDGKETLGLRVALRCFSNVSPFLKRKDRSRNAKAFGAGF